MKEEVLTKKFNHKIAFFIMIFFYGLDCLILTPYILFKGLGQETGLLLSWGYYQLTGLSFFYLWFFIFSVGLWFLLKYLFNFLDKRLGNLSIYPKLVLIITWSLLMCWVILNNLRYIK